MHDMKVALQLCLDSKDTLEKLETLLNIHRDTGDDTTRPLTPPNDDAEEAWENNGVVLSLNDIDRLLQAEEQRAVYRDRLATSYAQLRYHLSRIHALHQQASITVTEPPTARPHVFLKSIDWVSHTPISVNLKRHASG